MHAEKKYTDDEAEHIFVAVKGFMMKLACRCDEDGLPFGLGCSRLDGAAVAILTRNAQGRGSRRARDIVWCPSHPL